MNQVAITKTVFKNDTIPQKGTVVSEAVINLSKKYTKLPIIDLGAGSGALINRLARKYGSIACTGIDLYPKGENVIEGDITNLLRPDNSAQTVFCTDVIEHLDTPDLTAAISETYRILKPGSYAIFTTIANENLLRNYITCPGCGNQFHRRGHCQTFTKKDIYRLFTGFEIVEIRETKLHLEATFGSFLAKMFYLFKLDKLVKFHEKDLFIVVRKMR